MATFLTTIFHSSTYPYIHKEVIMVASDSLIALNQIINCISIIVYGWIWNNKSEKLFNFYPVYCVLETVFGILTTIYAITTRNIVAYYLLDTIVFAVITRNICCGGVKLRAIRYNSEEKREHFDNNNNSVSSLATILGSVIAMFLNLNFEIMLCVATFGNMIDNLFYIFIFYHTKECRKKRKYTYGDYM
ncbi:hypothetical protein C823_007753 [Eubacterium plexicaudatum ASF492]|uniref:Uncharacterized protein n=1 Tax=Eubacterium plexicaudatum ASF492 TaxID=1235802 RepID=N2A4U3_9FIRM|nr:hypothetical protein C823_007753 [Eubacterium plexicaudatum ASF492]